MDESVSVEAGGGAQGRIALGVLLALLVAVLAVPLLTSDSSHDELFPLGLQPGGGAQVEGAAMDMALWDVRYEYVLQGELPDLGDEGPVYRIVPPTLDATTAAAMAARFGVNGTASRDGDGYLVDDGKRMFSAWPSPAGWYVSVGESYRDLVPGVSEPGSPGMGGSGDSGDPALVDDLCARIEGPGKDAEYDGYLPECDPSLTTPVLPAESCRVIENEDGSVEEVCAGGGDVPVSDDGTDVMPVEDIEPWNPEPPANLPSAAEAERIARDLLQGAGVLEGTWEVVVHDGGAGIVYAEACSSHEECIEAESDLILLSRTVTFVLVLDGQRIDSLSWSVDVGDEGVVAGVWGQHASVEVVADYPLRPIQDAYDEMVAGEGQMWGGGDMMAMVASSGDVAVDGPISEIGVITEEFECPDDADCAVAPNESPPDAPPACKIQPDGSEICEPIDAPGGVDGDPGTPPDIEPGTDPGGVIEPDVMPLPEPQVVVITVTGAERSLMVALGRSPEGAEVAYIVPAYRFVGTWPEGEDWFHDAIGLAPEWIGGPTATTEAPPVTDTPPVSEPPSIPTTSIVDEEPPMTEPVPEPEPTPEPVPGPVPEPEPTPEPGSAPVTTVPAG